MIVEYELIQAEAEWDFVKIVNRHICEGWQPIGGVSMTRTDGERRNGDPFVEYEYCQAMVKYENKPIEKEIEPCKPSM